ncbi:MAG: serine hydrolase domain-containing protein, partial [Mariniphaga sp.]
MYLRKLTLLLFLFSLFCFSAEAQTKSKQKSPVLTEASPESAGVSSARLARIDNMLEQAVALNQVPGVVALIARNGKIVYWKAHGMADSENNKALKRDDIFRIASQSKAITSTAVMILWEEGKFRLDDPISKYIPEFKNPKVMTSFSYSDTTWRGVSAKSEITIRQLLTHTSGVGYGLIDGDERFGMIFGKAGIIDAFTTENITIAENIKKLAKM